MPLPPVLARIESSHRLNAPIVLTAISPTGSDAHGRPTPQWTPGQQFRARVLETDNAGRARVEVGGRQFMMTLPAWIHDGDSVELTYLHAQPRIAFALPRPPAPSGDAQVSLGAAARMIGALVQTDHTQAHDPRAPGSAGQRPAAAPLFVGTVPQAGAAPLTEPSTLIGAAPLAGALLAPLLRKALSQSGLFYESHQLQWLSGQRSLESLLAEPQGRLSTVRSDTPAMHPGTATGAAHPDTLAGAAHPDTSTGSEHPDPVPRAPHPDTLPLVRQQLDSLDTGRLAWEGLVWPGQPLYWEIDEPPSNADAGHPEHRRAWRTRLHLQLPGLGAVDAELSFADGAVRIELQAADADRATRMRAALPDLEQAMDAAGLPLAGATVRHA